MATKTVDFEVKNGTGISGSWIAVDEDDISLDGNNKASIQLKTGEHLLIWGMAGNSGASVSITGKVGNKEVVSVKSSSIRAGSNVAAGRKYFEV